MRLFPSVQVVAAAVIEVAVGLGVALGDNEVPGLADTVTTGAGQG